MIKLIIEYFLDFFYKIYYYFCNIWFLILMNKIVRKYIKIVIRLILIIINFHFFQNFDIPFPLLIFEVSDSERNLNNIIILILGILVFYVSISLILNMEEFIYDKKKKDLNIEKENLSIDDNDFFYSNYLFNFLSF